jgi:hypothetical protein
MSDANPQSFKNHGRLDPPFHFFVIPVFFASLIIAIVHLVRHFNFHSAWLVVLAFAAIVLAFKVRMYSIKVQDRVIRLEERLRLQSLAPQEWHAQFAHLNEDQLIGLRFAADDEVVTLAKVALEQKLTRKQIKERIKSWRADDWRV